MISYTNPRTGNVVSRMTEREEHDLALSEKLADAALIQARGSDSAWMDVARLACKEFGVRLTVKAGIATLSTTWKNDEEVINFFDARGIQTSSRDGRVTRRLNA